MAWQRRPSASRDSGTSWFEYDNDGRLDLFIANGAVTIVESLRAQPYPYGQSNLLFHNEGQHRSSETWDHVKPNRVVVLRQGTGRQG